jgi:4-oxalocrotonate tautomerase
MPHIIVKLWQGRSDEQKSKLVEKIVKDVADTFGIDEGNVSLAFEEVKEKDWKEQVYKPDILDKWDKLAKRPDYEM